MSDPTLDDARRRAIKAVARHVFLCWPRRWAYICAPPVFSRTCLKCGLIHERDRAFRAMRRMN